MLSRLADHQNFFHFHIFLGTFLKTCLSHFPPNSIILSQTLALFSGTYTEISIKISDDLFLVISPKFLNFSPNFLHFSGTSKILSICNLVSGSHQKNSIPTPAGSELELSCCSLLHVVRGD